MAKLRTPEKRTETAQRRRVSRRHIPAIEMLYEARKRAKRLSVPCTLTLEDFEIPTTCPVFGAKLMVGDGCGPSDWSPSLDRIVPELGYVPGNVRVISHLANVMKNKASFAQLRTFAEWVLRSCPSVTKESYGGITKESYGGTVEFFWL